MLETLNLTEEQKAQYEAFLEEFKKNIDPTDYLAPSVREVARMDMQTLKAEYDQVIAKESNRSSAQRGWIKERYEYELAKAEALAKAEEVEDDAE
jgi:hypothetical protein